MSTVWKPHVTVAAIVKDGARYLFVEEQVCSQLVINQPAGHLEAAETLPAAAVRETLEETGYEISVRSLVGIYRWRSPTTGQVVLRFAFDGEVLRHHRDRALDADIVRPLWLGRDELAAQAHRHRSAMVLRNVLDHEAGQRFPLDLLAEVGGPRGGG